MSGESLRVMTVFAFSSVTSVLNGGSSARAAPAVVLDDPGQRLVAAAAVRHGATAAPAVAVHELRRGWLSMQAGMRPSEDVAGRGARTTILGGRHLPVTDLEVDRAVGGPRQGGGRCGGERLGIRVPVACGVSLGLRFQHGITMPAMNITRTKHRFRRSASASCTPRFLRIRFPRDKVSSGCEGRARDRACSQS